MILRRPHAEAQRTQREEGKKGSLLASRATAEAMSGQTRLLLFSFFSFLSFLERITPRFRTTTPRLRASAPLRDKMGTSFSPVPIHLQWFSDNADEEGRTEQPTEHKIQRLKEEGQVQKARSLSGRLPCSCLPCCCSSSPLIC